MSTPANNLQTLWDAHRELTAIHNRLYAAGCRAACKKVVTAMRSVNATFTAESKRVDAALARAELYPETVPAPGRPYCTFCGGDFGKHEPGCPKGKP